MKPTLRRALVFVVLLLLVLPASAGLAFFSWLSWAKKPAQTGKAVPVRFTVAPGASRQSVAADLEAAHLIRSARVFQFIGKNEAIQPGVYDLRASDSPAVLLRHLANGDVATVRVTFPEGFTLDQVAKRLVKNGVIKDEAAFVTLVTTQGSTFRASFALPANLEGFLFPDTYRFPIGTDDKAVAQTMVDEFDRLFASKNADAIKASKKTVPELVNVAAMVEKEAETDTDRAPIAGVIYNRLAKNMRLQIDATVQYARGAHTTRVLYKDLAIVSPYNTYKNAGLPPGPICNPGLPSLEAALKPAKSDYLFYVGRPDGSHIFAKTYAEHQANIARVRKMPR